MNQGIGEEVGAMMELMEKQRVISPKCSENNSSRLKDGEIF